MGYEHIEVEFKDGLVTITLNRPPVNVLNIAMMKEINEALDAWKGKKDLKVVLFNGKGKCFSAGVDVGEHMGDLAPKMIETFHGMFRLMDQLGAVTVASVYGLCLGGGCELAVFCDLVIADDTAKFGQPEIQVGVLPPIAAQIMPRIIGRKVIADDTAKFGQPEIQVGVLPPIAAQIMPRIIGRKVAMDLILSGRIVAAQESMSMGLINKVVAKGDLSQETDEFIKPYLSLSAEVIRITKKTIKAGLRDDFEPSLKVIEEIYLNELMRTTDAQEGLKAFLEKRTPEWKNC
ncbi:MAG: enoyl-CoA hydratase/isomerase family protein [Deltaproteobacteria bacterium]|nr:enoyl-CoA hydratase/isomerase family protein [Deltaproteobacteria bacterium]